MRRSVVQILAAVEQANPKDWLERLWIKTGYDLLELARQLDVRPQTAVNSLHHYKIPYASPNANQRCEKDWVRRRAFFKRTGYTSTKEAVQAVIDNDLTAYHGAKFLGVDRRTVVRWAEENNLTLRTPRTNRYTQQALDARSTRIQQQAMTSRCITMPDGTVQTLDYLAQQLGITRCAMRYRINNWGVERALSTPVKQTTKSNPKCLE